MAGDEMSLTQYQKVIRKGLKIGNNMKLEKKVTYYLELPSYIKYKMCLGYVSISSSAPRPLGAAYAPILLREVEQKQRPIGNGDREAIVVGAGLRL